jgi:hypothetical protein
MNKWWGSINFSILHLGLLNVSIVIYMYKVFIRSNEQNMSSDSMCINSQNKHIHIILNWNLQQPRIDGAKTEDILFCFVVM